MKITVDQLHEAVRKQFCIEAHHQKRLQVDAYRCGSKNLALITMVGIAERCNIPKGEVMEFLRIDAEAYSSFLYRFDKNVDGLTDSNSVAVRKAKLVKNYIFNYFRYEITL
jgi:hypothetical protein